MLYAATFQPFSQNFSHIHKFKLLRMQRLLLFLFITSNIFAQSTDPAKLKWEFRGPTNVKLDGKSITDIASDPNDPFENTIWGVTASGQVVINREIRKPDSRWSELPIEFDVKKIVFQPNSPNIVFAVLNSQKFLLKSTDDGKTWSNVAVPEISNNLIENLKISQRGRLVIALSNGTFMYSDNGGEVWVNANVSSFNNIANFWVGDNNKIFIRLLDDIYSTESPYTNWQKIDLDKALSEGFIANDTFFEQFSSYITDKGIYYGFVPNRRRIITANKTFSSDAGVTFRSFNFPANLKEVVFAGEELIFATADGVFLRKNASDFPLEPRNNGIETEFKMAAVRDISGDDFIQGISTKNLFSLRNISSNYGIIYPNQLSEYRFIRDFESTTYLGNSNYIELKIDNKLIYPAEEIIPINNALSYIRYDRNGLKKVVQYTTEQNNVRSESVIAPDNAFYSKSAVDIAQNNITKSISILFSDGSVALIKNPSLYKNSFAQFTAISTPLSQNAAYVVPLSDTDKDWLICTKNGEIYYTNDTGQSWKNINTTSIRNLIINHLEYSTTQKTLFLATSNGIWIGQDISGANPKWTDITKDFTEKSFNHVLYRERDGLIVATNRQKGIYTTNWFAKANTIITQAPSFIPSFENYNTDGAREATKFCVGSKINVPFATDLPQDGSYEFTVDLLRNDSLNSKIITLNGKSSKSPVEVEIPADLKTDYYRFRVNAKGSATVSGIESGLVLASPNKIMSESSKLLSRVCPQDSVIVGVQSNLNLAYTWKKDNKVIEGLTSQFFKTSTFGVYERTLTQNGCIVENLTFVLRAGATGGLSISGSVGQGTNWNNYSLAQNDKMVQYKGQEVAFTTPYTNDFTYDFKLLRNGIERIRTQSKFFLNSLSTIGGDVQSDNGTYYYEYRTQNCTSRTSNYFRIGREIQNETINLNIASPNTLEAPITHLFSDKTNTSSLSRLNTVYEWYKDSMLIAKQNYSPTATTFNKLTLEKEGNYSLKIDIEEKRFSSLSATYTNGRIVVVNQRKRCEGILLSAIVGKDTKQTDFSGTYQWFINKNEIRNANKLSLIVKSVGQYQLIATDENGMPFRSATIIITEKDFLQAPKIQSEPDACGQTTVLKVEDDNLLQFNSFQWYKDGQKTDGDTLPFIRVGKAGTYSLRMKVDNIDTECAFSPSITFTPKPDFTPNIALSYGSNCVVDSFKVYTDFSNEYRFDWFKDGVLVPNQKTNELIIKDLSRYQVVVTRNDGCQRFSEFIQLKSCADPKTNRAVLINPPVINTNKTNLFVPETTILRTEGCRDANFQWLLDNKPIKDAKLNTLEVNSTGNYSLQIEKFGCVATSNTIKIVAEQLLSAEDEINTTIKIYPNPTSSKILVETIQQTIDKNYIYLSDNLGKLLEKWHFQDKKEINLEHLPAGIYYLKIETNGKVLSRKLIKN